jgi:type IV pilus assembly protein PilM
LKKNARQAEDPKTIFQAMRPIFNDFVTEVQRSLGFFQSIDRKAKLNRFVMLGNACKLPGLQQYLSKNLDMKLVELNEFPNLEGSDVVDAPSFKDNILSFAVSYGAALQGLGRAKLSTNLVPPEIITQRIIREKKPWALAAAALLLLACSVHYFFTYNTWRQVHPKRVVNNVAWKSAISGSTSLNTQSQGFKTDDAAKLAQMAHLKAIGDELVKNSDGRLLWLELMKAVNQSLPVSDGIEPGTIPTPKELPFMQRKELHIEYMESEYFTELQTWFTEEVKTRYITSKAAPEPTVEEAVDPDAEQPEEGNVDESGQLAATDEAAAEEEELIGPEGPGWVIELKGYHFFNENTSTWGGAHVRSTLIKELENGIVNLPVAIKGGNAPLEMTDFTMKELGISFPVITHSEPIRPMVIPNPEYAALASLGAGTGLNGERSPTGNPLAPNSTAGAENPLANIPQQFEVKVYHFTVQFCWQEKRLNERLQFRMQKELEEQQQAEQNQLAGGN